VKVVVTIVLQERIIPWLQLFKLAIHGVVTLCCYIGTVMKGKLDGQ